MASKTPPEFELQIEKLVFGGEGLGYYQGRPVFVFGVLPGERVEVSPIKVNSKFVKARLNKVLLPSPDRQKPRDSHFLTSSPWEIMSASVQLQYKKEIVLAMWKKLAGACPPVELAIEASEKIWGYRNKLEFSFTTIGQKLQLAFHERYRFNRFLPLTESALAPVTMNNCAQQVVKELNARQFNLSDLKNLLVKYSFANDNCLVVLFVTNKDFPVFAITAPEIIGWQIVYSQPQSPAAVFTQNLYHQGELVLEEKLGRLSLAYGPENFFQVNPQAFAKLLGWVNAILPPGQVLLDLYAGVGTIGFYFAPKFKKVISLEADPLASEFALANARRNRLTNIEIVRGQAEKQDLVKLLKSADTLIVDPPRSGLHPKVLKKILEKTPETFVYISCNPATQARDWQALNRVYHTRQWRLFDLYPQTPHVESVLLLRKK